MNSAGIKKVGPESTQAIPFWALLVLALCSVLAHLLLVPLAEDDAFIHMRIARTLAESGVPYFDAHLPLSASSSPLWVFIITPLAWMGNWMPYGVALLNSLIWVVAIRGVCRLGERLTSRLSRNDSLLIAICTASILLPSSVGLMETPLAVLLCSWSAVLLLRGSSWWIGCAVAAPFVRPESVVYTCILAVQRLRTGSPLRVRECLICAFSIALTAGGYVFFFGLTLPHSIAAKSVVYSLSFTECVTFVLFASFGEWIARNVLPACIVTGATSFLVGLWTTRPTSHCAHPGVAPISRDLVLGALLIVTGYCMQQVLTFPWYAPLFLIPITLGAVVACKGRAYAYRVGALAAILPVLLKSFSVLVGIFTPSLSPMFPSGARANTLHGIGNALFKAFPDATIVAPEIGALGFSFKGRVIDAVGLTYPNALRFHPLSVPEQRPVGFLGVVPGLLIQETSPDFVVGLPSLLYDAVKSGALAGYSRHSVPIRGGSLIRSETAKSVWGNNSIDVYAKSSRQVPPGLTGKADF